MLLQIQTSRLTLLPFTKSICEETLNDSTAMLNSLGITPGKGWPDLETLETLPRIIVHLNKVSKPSGFESWMIIERSTNLLIGDVGFKGPPNEAGEVDLGYGVIANERRKGFAHEAAAGLLEWAFDHETVKAITASCLRQNSGSQKILSSLHFNIIKEDDDMFYWRLPKII